MANDRELMLAYLAGIVDGEGSIGKYSSRGGRYYEFTIEVKMTHKETIELLSAQLGGSIVHRKAGDAKWKDQWRWRVRGKKAVAVYAELAPYLRVKKLT